MAGMFGGVGTAGCHCRSAPARCRDGAPAMQSRRTLPSGSCRRLGSPTLRMNQQALPGGTPSPLKNGSSASPSMVRRTSRRAGSYRDKGAEAGGKTGGGISAWPADAWRQCSDATPAAAGVGPTGHTHAAWAHLRRAQPLEGRAPAEGRGLLGSRLGLPLHLPPPEAVGAVLVGGIGRAARVVARAGRRPVQRRPHVVDRLVEWRAQVLLLLLLLLLAGGRVGGAGSSGLGVCGGLGAAVGQVDRRDGLPQLAHLRVWGDRQ